MNLLKGSQVYCLQQNNLKIIQQWIDVKVTKDKQNLKKEKLIKVLANQLNQRSKTYIFSYIARVKSVILNSSLIQFCGGKTSKIETKQLEMSETCLANKYNDYWIPSNKTQDPNGRSIQILHRLHQVPRNYTAF